jgi:hypothetical protein
MPYHEIKADGLPPKPGYYEIRTTFEITGKAFFNGDTWNRYYTPYTNEEVRVELDDRNQVTHWRCA